MATNYFSPNAVTQQKASGAYATNTGYYAPNSSQKTTAQTNTNAANNSAQNPGFSPRTTSGYTSTGNVSQPAVSDQQVEEKTGLTAQQLDDMLAADIGNIEAYYNKLNEIAQGDRDFVLKWIKREFETSMGTDDTARAQFMAQVASADEERMGRIPYDYEKYTQRQLEDYKLGLDASQRALKRVKEDYETARQGKEIDWGEARQNQSESLISTGLMQGTRRNQLQEGGIAGQRMQKLEDTIGQERQQLETDQNRALEDIQTEREQLDIQNKRNLGDITDEYRRKAVDELYNKEYGEDKAEHEYQNSVTRNNSSREAEIGQKTNDYNAYYGKSDTAS